MFETTVVRIYATTQDSDYDAPWQARSPTSATGSGVVIGPRQILTGAHVVANSTFIQVQRISESDKALATVAAVCHDCDLALLEVADEAFLARVEPATLGELPDLRDRVSVVGFPVGGDEVSITEGVVSRIEVQEYSHSQRRLLSVTVDAAINSGNSGGPVFRDGKVVGIAFQKLTGAEAVGEMVPATIVQHFLDGASGRSQVRVPGLGIETQNLENPLLRQRVGLSEGQSGLLIISVEFEGSAWEVLQPGDALLEIDGLAIANSGTVRYRGQDRTQYDVVLGDHDVGDHLPLTILRNGERLELELELKAWQALVARPLYDIQPRYFVFGGLVFQPLTQDFLASWENWRNMAPKEFLNHYYSGVRTPERREIVVLSHVLADELNVGYEHFHSESIVSIDGHFPRDLAEFVAHMDAGEGISELRTSRDGVIVLDRDAVREADARILTRYRIGRSRSPDLD